mgnify:CR=1 FL=1
MFYLNKRKNKFKSKNILLRIWYGQNNDRHRSLVGINSVNFYQDVLGSNEF